MSSPLPWNSHFRELVDAEGKLLATFEDKTALRETIEAVNSHAKQQERIEELEKALKPFSDEAAIWEGFKRQNWSAAPEGSLLKVRHLRAARAALSKGASND